MSALPAILAKDIIKDKDFQNRIFKAFIIIVIIVIAVIAFKKIKKIVEGKDRTTREAGREVENSGLTLLDSEYESISDSILENLSGWNVTSNGYSNVINSLRQLRTKDDWLKLVEVFGVRESNAKFSNYRGNLIEWLTSEFTSAYWRGLLTQTLTPLGVNIF